MFDKLKFTKILNDISDTYGTITEFAKKSGVNRTYLSQYINQKLDSPPSPKILEKIATNSQDIITYEELMNICGYININKDYGSVPVYATSNKKDRKINFLIDLTQAEELSPSENKAFTEIANILIDCLKNDKIFDIKHILNCKKYLYSQLSIAEKNDVLEYLNPLISEINYVDAEYNNSLNTIPIPELEKVKIPVLGIVKAGYDYLVNENIVGYVFLDFNPSDPENYYALQVTGDSMEPLFSAGDIAIVHKQDNFESGNTCIVLINGDEATVKKVVKMDDGIDLIAMNPYYPVRHFSKNEMNDIPVKVVGKVIEARKRKQFE